VSSLFLSIGLRSFSRIFHRSNNGQCNTSHSAVHECCCLDCFFSQNMEMSHIVLKVSNKKREKKHQKRAVMLGRHLQYKKERYGLWLMYQTQTNFDGTKSFEFNLGEWNLIRASAFWESLAQMESAVRIKFPTVNIKTCGHLNSQP